jgi:hypothetical protein
MRLANLRAAVPATAILTALTLAGAPAAGAQHLQGIHQHAAVAGCRVSLFAEPHMVASGESAQLFGTLSCPSLASATNQAVTIYEHSAGTGGFRIAGTATSGAGGFYSLVAPTLSTNSVFYAVSAGKRSPSRTVKVAPIVTLAGPSELAQLRTGPSNRVTFTGTVTPADAGAILVLQRENATAHEEWGAIGFGVVGAGGSFSITHRFSIPGDANLRVIVRPHGRLTLRGISNTLSYVISQRQNPHLTINSSADPAAYGQTVTLSGVLAAGANQKVKLSSHPRGGAPFAPVGETTTNSSGEYSFPVTALRNTAYQVSGAAIKSAVLYEGVKYVLTATASTNTIPSGQALTFSGTATPSHAGHVVYLERENAFGGGFHVADVGVVSLNGTYSINHFVFGSGKQVFRIHIPGDPENQGISSSTFNVELTPPAPGSLRPVPGSRQPSEGKI